MGPQVQLDAVRNGRDDDVDPCAAAIADRAAREAAGKETVLSNLPTK